MKKTLAVVLAASLSMVLGASTGVAADTKDFEAVFKDMVDTMNKVGDVLATVKDQATADKAQPEAKKLGAQMKELKAKAEKLGKPTPEQEKVLKDKFQKEMEAATKKMIEQATRLSTTEYGKTVLKELDIK
jgi:hypothetical protein